MIPAPVALVFFALIGWPTVKLAATIISRPMWRSQRRLKAELNASYDEQERKIIADEFDQGRGNLLQLALPVVAFFGGFSAAFSFSGELVEEKDAVEIQAKIEAITYERMVLGVSEANRLGAKRLFQDKRFRELSDRAFMLEMLRYPVCTCLTGIAIIPALVLLICLTGVRVSVNKVARAIISGSQASMRAFAHSLETLGRPA